MGRKFQIRPTRKIRKSTSNPFLTWSGPQLVVLRAQSLRLRDGYPSENPFPTFVAPLGSPSDPPLFFGLDSLVPGAWESLVQFGVERILEK